MSTDIVKIPINMLNGIKDAFGSNNLPMPFVKEIFLMNCHVAGTSYSENIEQIEKELKIKDILILQRDSENPYDNLAILVLDEKGRKVGFVPKDKNEVIAHLMDAGKLIFGKIEEKESQAGWLEIKIRVFMKDF